MLRWQKTLAGPLTAAGIPGLGAAPDVANSSRPRTARHTSTSDLRGHEKAEERRGRSPAMVLNKSRPKREHRCSTADGLRGELDRVHERNRQRRSAAPRGASY